MSDILKVLLVSEDIQFAFSMHISQTKINLFNNIVLSPEKMWSMSMPKYLLLHSDYMR